MAFALKSDALLTGGLMTSFSPNDSSKTVSPALIRFPCPSKDFSQALVCLPVPSKSRTVSVFAKVGTGSSCWPFEEPEIPVSVSSKKGTGSVGLPFEESEVLAALRNELELEYVAYLAIRDDKKTKVERLNDLKVLFDRVGNRVLSRIRDYCEDRVVVLHKYLSQKLEIEAIERCHNHTWIMYEATEKQELAVPKVEKLLIKAGFEVERIDKVLDVLRSDIYTPLIALERGSKRLMKQQSVLEGIAMRIQEINSAMVFTEKFGRLQVLKRELLEGNVEGKLYEKEHNDLIVELKGFEPRSEYISLCATLIDDIARLEHEIDEEGIARLEHEIDEEGIACLEHEIDEEADPSL